MKEDWSRWYTKDYVTNAEKCFLDVLPLLPRYVKSVIDFGCAAGRNLAAFKSTHSLFGVDIADENSIEFQVSNITYMKSRLQDFTFRDSLETFLCISHGTLMYLNPAEQRKFIDRLIRKGCRNFIFQEYDARTLRLDNYFEPSDLFFDIIRHPLRGSDLLKNVQRGSSILTNPQIGYAFRNPFNFEKRWFRPTIPAWLSLDR